MIELTKDTIFNNLLSILTKLAGDWEYSDEITSGTFLVSDLGFESIDIVVLGTTIEKYYNQPMPFAQFFSRVGQREVRDIRIDELIDFIYENVNKSQSQ